MGRGKILRSLGFQSRALSLHHPLESGQIFEDLDFHQSGIFQEPTHLPGLFPLTDFKEHPSTRLEHPWHFSDDASVEPQSPLLIHQCLSGLMLRNLRLELCDLPARKIGRIGCEQGKTAMKTAGDRDAKIPLEDCNPIIQVVMGHILPRIVDGVGRDVHPDGSSATFQSETDGDDSRARAEIKDEGGICRGRNTLLMVGG